MGKYELAVVAFLSLGDYHTSGVTVTHGWKIRNVAKDKWFVMVAKTATDKQHWMEVIRNQRDRISS